MENLDTTQACFVVDDDLLNITLDGGEVQEEALNPTILKGSACASSSSLDSSSPVAAASFGSGKQNRSFPEFVEEELEWLSNKDAFPAVETCFGILSDNPELVWNHQSPVSVLENRTNSSNNSNTNSSSNNSNTNSSSNNNNSFSVASCCNSLKVPTSYPVRARTKRSRRRCDLVHWPSQHNIFKKNRRDISFSLPRAPVRLSSGGAGGIGRRCLHCQVDKTPQWRAGPMGPKTLCNACGVRYKSGRLLPEYRPANSPAFSSLLHSNSHRKVVEMRRRKQVGPGDGIAVNAATSCGYNVG